MPFFNFVSYVFLFLRLCVLIFMYVLFCVFCFHRPKLSSRLLSKNLKIKIYRTIILLVVFYGCETWSLTLREESLVVAYSNNQTREGYLSFLCLSLIL